MIMPSKYQRKQNEITPKRTFICCEDTEKAPKYFEEFLSYFRIDTSRVRILKKTDTRSSPDHILNEIEKFKKELKDNNDYYAKDEFWLVVDVDRWGANLSRTIAFCNQRKYNHAVSNPCFEIWLLLHYVDGTLLNNDPTSYSKSIINNQLSNYNLSGRNDKDYFPQTDNAVLNTEQIDTDRLTGWPQKTGTRIYRLIRELNLYVR